MLCMVTVIYTHFKLYNEATSQKCGVRLVFACTVTYISVQLTVKGGDGVPLTCEHLARFYTTEKKEPQIITLLKAREFNQRHLNGVVQSITRDCITSWIIMHHWTDILALVKTSNYQHQSVDYIIMSDYHYYEWMNVDYMIIVIVKTKSAEY